MKPTSIAVRPKPRSVCQLCDYIRGQSSRYGRTLRTSTLIRTTAPRPQLRPQLQPHIQQRLRNAVTPRPASRVNAAPTKDESYTSGAEAALEVANAQKAVNAILTHDQVPSEEATLAALRACESAARRLTNRTGEPLPKPKDDTTPASALLSLDSRPAPSEALTKPIDLLSNLAYKLLLHPPVFISPDVLKTYVITQALLERPTTFPEIFALYATKPVPQPQTHPPRYKSPNPRAARAAIPTDVANLALGVALATKDLHTALSIIETSFRAPAYRRNKILRKAVPPLLGAAFAPLAAYTVAAQLSSYQETMDPALATKIAFAGILTYVGATATIGVVAVATANDQMERVTWATGMPLRERWLREDERAAVDRVACAWGFDEVWRRGEEEGAEWEALREWVGLRGMVLDRVELMEGME
ncbi:hypothetical protein H2201_001231 [Coniosporium apollinis]|uniref:Uncharacterized protein n=1 Tax=Coniosporium apollinis TaxID=61459 RepID=A0ABQ9P1W8_9PEZI|nr:hypothetical protein H2201_001231 [Coniosporium apollinis]